MSSDPTRRSNLTFIIGGLVLLVVLCIGLFFAAKPYFAPDRTFDAEDLSDQPPPAARATKVARAFLDAWASGQLQAAGTHTDAPETTAAGLQAYATWLGTTKVSFDQLTATGPSPTDAHAKRLTLRISAQTSAGTWTYPGTIDVVQDNDDNAAVHWSHAVLYPTLTEDQRLTAGRLPAGEGTATVVASDGHTKLNESPSLLDVAGTIRDHAASTGGSPGTGIMITDAQGKPVKTLQVFSKEKAPTVRTTIDAQLQSVAEQAVKDPKLGGDPAGVVALDWRTGHILAIAYAGGDGDIAINAVKAPGSTMKIITAAALFDQAGLSPSSPAPCTDSILARGQTFHNDPGVHADPGATLAQAFTVSCNTSFIKDGFHYLVNDGDASALHREAADVFGLGSWSVGGGLGTRDPSIPPDVEGGDQAAQFIGQGKVTATPLVMASVAATVRAGRFEQPIIVPGAHQVAAPRQISPRTDGFLQSMMRSVATSGTAAPRLGGLAGVGGKTGTAEEGDHTNGWLTAYDDRIAVAALVEGGSSGVDSAGYVVRTLLTND